MPQMPEQNRSSERWSRLRVYLWQRPVMLALMTALAVLFFLLVTGLTRAYQAQRRSLGNRWYERGVADLNSQRFDAAVTDFRAALLYSRDNYNYQLNLAEALLGMNHTAEASVYLMNLWDRQPEDGLVNLELARITAQKGQAQQAIRHYHDAVYAAWPPQSEGLRQKARLELIDLLLRNNENQKAQAELIAMSENADDDPEQHRVLGDLFVRAGDYQHAFTEYRLSLKTDPRNAKALAGLGLAAYQLGRYPLAQQYLGEAMKSDPSDSASAERWKTTALILCMDPFRRQITMAERNRRVVEAFSTAGQRLEKCASSNGNGPRAGGQQPDLSQEWSSLKPQISVRGLQLNPDLTERAMDLVFRVERETSSSCGPPAGPDLALLLLSNLHEGNSF
ncbi:MAG TPA: tetratricopeptide repeat protein [Candidatus Sulfotelmatobacter sp.]|nr:tetratricopeptide repeat protein [Candidatus Sulfotelmatobacter sp.]